MIKRKPKTPNEMDRAFFIWSLPGDTQEEKARAVGFGQSALSRWKSRPPRDRREEIMLAGWALLTPEQRTKALKNAGY